MAVNILKPQFYIDKHNKICRKLGIEMPITKQVYLLLHKGKRPTEALKSLMVRKL